MIAIEDFLARLKSHGVQFRLEGEALRFKAPQDLPDGLRADMSTRKDEIRAVLAAATRRTPALEPIRPAPRDGALPLSFAQQRLWFLDQWQPGNPIYNEPAALRIEGELDRAALERSLQAIVRRHEVFRTTYEAVAGEPRQIVHDEAALALAHADLRGAGETALRAAVDEAVNRPFDLARDLMLRATLMRTAEHEHVLVLVMHHIACDGWSAGVLVREFVALYSAFREDEPSPLEPLPIQYADFALWQRGKAQADRLARELVWWRGHLAGAPTKIELPTDLPRPAEETFNGDRHVFTIPANLANAMRGLAQGQGATLFMSLFAAFNVLLRRYSGQDDLVVGSAIANRDRRELEPLVGFFVNTLALRSDLSGDPSFHDLVARTRRVAEDAFAHQALPFERLVEALSPNRNLSHAPLFQVMFSLQNMPSSTLELPDLHIAPIDLTRNKAKFDLILFVREQGDELVGTFEYNTDLFLPGTIARMGRHFTALLESIAAAPDAPISRLSMLPEDERRLMLETWNATGVDFPRDSCIQDLFEQQVNRSPGAPAISGPEGAMSYRELDRAANRLAHRLLRAGVGPGEPVGVAMERSTAFIVSVLAILKAGGAYLPLDPGYPRERLRFMLDDSGARLVVTRAAHADAMADTDVTLIDFDEVHVAGEEGSPGIEAEPLRPACIVYTSGSTGTPKGVVVPHRAVLRLVCNTDYVDLPNLRRMAHVSNVSFDAATFEIWGALLHGGEIVVIARETLLSPDAFADALRDEGIDAMFLTVALFNQLANARPDAFGGLRSLLVGGEKMLPEPVRKVLLSGAPPRALLNAYGPTETTTFAVTRPVAAIPPGAQSIPIGRPIANTTLYVLDEAMQPVPVGVFGELYIGGEGVALGYLNRPELTAERFVENPFGPGRLYRTGDKARYLADGDVECGGRFDHQIKLRGYRIELGEIESCLRDHPDLRDALVMAREVGEGDTRLVAYMIARDPGEDARDEQVSQWQALFDTTYGEKVVTRTAARLEYVDPARNFTGWESSYTGEAIPEVEMREWLEGTIAEIEALAPERVLEIGCGTGLLLARLAPGRAVYHGTDFSQAAIDTVEALRRDRPELAHVKLFRQSGEDVSGLDRDGYDAIVLNSVVQYFPSISYLVTVLEAAESLLRPGGRIYVGDVRNHDLRTLFHASIKGYRAGGSLSVAALRERIQEGVLDEEELLVAPGFFRDIARFVPGLACERIGLKRGGFHNELTRFRYQVVLGRDSDEGAPECDAIWRDWRDERPGIDALRRILRDEQRESFGLTAVGNTRLRAESALLALLAASAEPQALAPPLDTLHADPALDPHALEELARECGYEIAITYSEIADAGAFDVLFTRNPVHGAMQARPRRREAQKPLDAYANDPLLGKFSRRLTPVIRHYLQTRLPDYMIPASYLFLPHWPLTPNGKIDRAALPDPSRQRGGDGVRHVPARSDVERTIAGIWQGVLGLEGIGVHENFFEIGGHSLLATQIVSRLRDSFDVDIGLRGFFEKPTIAELAVLLDAQVGNADAGDQEDFLI
jgi:amino acid adenylation domain-containing protein